MSQLSFFLSAITFVWGVSVSAQETKELPLVPNYNCQVILIVENENEVIHEKFMADFASGSHGGREYVFEKGPQTVIVMASNNWMAVQWERADKIVAAGHFAISKPTLDFHRVVLLLNPKNPNEQVSLDCSPESME